MKEGLALQEESASCWPRRSQLPCGEGPGGIRRGLQELGAAQLEGSRGARPSSSDHRSWKADLKLQKGRGLATTVCSL